MVLKIFLSIHLLWNIICYLIYSEDTLSLEMQSSVTVNEGDSLKLTCKVQGVRGQLSVTWQHKPTSTPAAAFTNIISLNQEGVMEKGAEFSRRNVTAVRPAVDTFTLELDGVTPSDSGVYQCAVSEWKINSKIISQSHTATVTVTPTGKISPHMGHSSVIHNDSCSFI